MNSPELIWFLVGAALLLAEFAAPGLVILFFGVGAVIASLACWLGLADTLPSQLLIFSIASLVCLLTLRKYMKSWFVGDSRKEVDEIKDDFVDQKVTVIVAIPGGSAYGKVEFHGAEWNATSTLPQEVGETVTIIARDGLKLRVI